MAPKNILRQGAQTVYGWLMHHAMKASQLAFHYDQWTYGPRPDGSWGAIGSERALRLESLARRLWAKAHVVYSHSMAVRQHGYKPWPGV